MKQSKALPHQIRRNYWGEETFPRRFVQLIVTIHYLCVRQSEGEQLSNVPRQRDAAVDCQDICSSSCRKIHGWILDGFSARGLASPSTRPAGYQWRASHIKWMPDQAIVEASDTLTLISVALTRLCQCVLDSSSVLGTRLAIPKQPLSSICSRWQIVPSITSGRTTEHPSHCSIVSVPKLW